MEGALFFIGDVHACQGDGEIVGTGIEVPAEVEVTLHVRKGRSIRCPRGEDEAYVFTVGNVFDPAYTAVCKLSKEVLAGLLTKVAAARRETGRTGGAMAPRAPASAPASRAGTGP